MFKINHHHHHHHVAIKKLGNWLTRSVSRIQKSLQWSLLVPFAFWDVIVYQSG
jgi:hypothetical protein